MLIALRGQGGTRCPQRVGPAAAGRLRRLMSCTFGGLSDIILRRNRPILSGKAVSLTNARLSVEAAVPAAIRDCAGDTPATTAHRAPQAENSRVSFASSRLRRS